MFIDAATTTRLNEVTALLTQGETLLVAIAGFVSVGLGGFFLAARKVLHQLKGVEDKVDPVNREITDRSDDTLATRVDGIVERIDQIDTERERQHEDNTSRLDRIESRMDQMQSDIGGIRAVLDKMLVKLAGLQ